MKEKIILLTIVMLSAIALSSCGNIENESEMENQTEVDVKSQQSTEEPGTITLDLSQSGKPEVSKVILSGRIGNRSTLENLYKIDILSTDVVGLVGCPVFVDTDGGEGNVVFVVDEEKTSVPMANMTVLFYNDKSTFYEEVPFTINDNEVELNITQSGTYMLADKYEWYSAWGINADEYAHDLTYTDRTFNFKVNIPKEITYDIVSSYWQQGERIPQGLIGLPLIEQRNESNSILTICLEALRFPAGSEEKIDNPHPVVPLDEYTDEFMRNLESAGGYKEEHGVQSASFKIENAERQSIRLNNGKQGFLLIWDCIVDGSQYGTGDIRCKNYRVHFEYNEDTFIELTYVITNENAIEEMNEKVMESIYSFGYFE